MVEEWTVYNQMKLLWTTEEDTDIKKAINPGDVIQRESKKENFCICIYVFGVYTYLHVWDCMYVYWYNQRLVFGVFLNLCAS